MRKRKHIFGGVRFLSIVLCLLVFVGAYSTPAEAQICPAGLSHYWTLDEAAGPTYNDFFGTTDANCTSCPTAVSGVVQGAQQFNNNSRVSVPADASFNWGRTASFSVELWARVDPSNTCQGDEVFIGRDDSTTSLEWWVGCLQGGLVGFQLDDRNGSSRGITSTRTINDGAWHHIVAVRDGNTNENLLYIDGDAPITASITYTAGFDSTTAELNIGWLNLGGGFPFTDELDEIALYNRALDQREIKTNYYLSRGYCEACSAPVAIMPAGDSITEGVIPGVLTDPTLMVSYRQKLFLDLTNSYYNVDFVGAQTYGINATPAFDYYSNGIPGYRIAGGSIGMKDHIYDWLLANPADVVLIHIGTNDLVGGDPIPYMLGGIITILNEVDRYDPNVTVVLARIINFNPTNTLVTQFNDQVVALAQSRIASGDKIIIADLEHSLTYPGDMQDQLHPKQAGYDKMAGTWLMTLQTFLPACGSVAPTILSTPVTQAYISALYTYDVNATSAPNPVYSLTSAPAWLSINEDTGLIQGTPPVGSAGSYQITVRVENNLGPAIQSYTLQVMSDIYISDLTWVSSTNGWGPIERDRSNGELGAADGTTLRINGVAYTKGLGAHALSDLRVAIPSGCTQFQATVGVDDEKGNNGSVTFTVSADGAQLFQSGTLLGSGGPASVSVNVSGRSELRLQVGNGGDNISYDHADWAEARFTGCGPDGTPPVISNIGATGITSTSATIGWTTNEPADGQVEYGLTTAYGSTTPLQTALTTAHQVSLGNLTANTPYHYRVLSRDASGNLRVSPDQTFTTSAVTSTLYLSDLTWVSSTNGWGPIERDRSNGELGAADGTTLRINGEAYTKGLGAHSLSDLRVAIPSGCTQFQATVGVDDEMGNNGSVTFTVSADGAQLFQSGTLLGSGGPASVSVNVSGRSELRLQVGNGGDNISYDHADWAEARFTGCGPDGTPPVISNIGATGITSTSATIGWTTNEPADGQVEYGLTTAYGSTTPLQTALTTAHQVSLGNLTANTPYHYRVLSRDASGNLRVSPDQTFTTSAAASTLYLSDLTWVSSTNGWGPIERDRSNGELGAADGTTLRINGEAYTKGLGAHSLSDLRVAIPSGCTQFQATVGVDDEMGNNGSVTFTVSADGAQLFQSGTLLGSGGPASVSVNVSGRSELRLQVGNGGDNINYDHADWADARFTGCGGL